jgi:hypothetical protein
VYIDAMLKERGDEFFVENVAYNYRYLAVDYATSCQRHLESR